MLRSRVDLWAKARAVVALAFLMGSAHAHMDGDVSQPQHVYKCTISGCVYKKTANEACQQRATLSSGTMVSLQWNSSSKVFACSWIIPPGTNPTTGNIQEEHCDGWQRGHQTDHASIISACFLRSDTCATSAYEHTETWDSNRTPFGFTVPDVAGLPEPWDSYRGCSFKLQSFTPNGNCTRVNYTGTGAEAIDEDAGPGQTAVAQGNPYSTSIPPDCDPATGNSTDNGPQVSSTSCAQRAGNTTSIYFHFNDQTYPEPPEPPAWSCIRGCKAVPIVTNGIYERFCGYDAADSEPGYCLYDYRFPFEDQPNYGLCQANTEADSLYTPRNPDAPEGPAGTEEGGSGTDGGAGGTDVSGVEDRLDQIHDALTECDTSRGDICGPGDVSSELEKGEPGLTAMDGVANGGMGQAEAGALDDNAPAWSDRVTGWATGVGANCTPLSGQLLNVSFEVDYCAYAELARAALYWVFAVMGVFHLFWCWQRAAEV